MAKTEIHEWPLPELTAAANVPQDMKNLADQIDRQTPHVCTSNTRPAPISGLIIYETDTSRTYIGEGSRWQHISSQWKAWTPSFKGWQNLGSSPTQQGWYLVESGGKVTIRARLRSGANASMGLSRLTMSLPFKGANIPVQQFGDASFLNTGPSGILRTGLIALGVNGAVDGELLVDNGNIRSPGPAGYPWGSGSELHINLTYVSELANAGLGV